MVNKATLKTLIVVDNRKAHFKFAILDTIESGLVLNGHEVKSLRKHNISIDEAIIREDKGELFLFGSYIAPYSYSTNIEYNPLRIRKLLLHKEEIVKLAQQVQVKGMTIVPLKIYFKNGKAKVLIGLCKGKNIQDKRESIKKRDTEREIRFLK